MEYIKFLRTALNLLRIKIAKTNTLSIDLNILKIMGTKPNKG